MSDDAPDGPPSEEDAGESDAGIQRGADGVDVDCYGDDERAAADDFDADGEQPDEFDAVVARVRERVTPTPEDRAAMEEAVAELTSRVEAELADLPVDAEVKQVGSTGRATWLADDRDIDLFVCFPPDVDRADLERWGLHLGNRVLPDGREEYAEHPYVTGEFRGFDVDLVPCFAVDEATDIRSAVDRTPFHAAYLDQHLDPALAGDVRVTKQFLTAIGAYGSDLKTRGFSGYLAELLVLAYGGFRPLVEAAADWHPPVELDPADHGRATFDDPLVVIDPTDPHRNVAAVCSAENVARVTHYARALLADPRESLFVREDPDPLPASGVEAHLERRGTTPVAVVFDAPDIVEDQLYPQLRRSLGGVEAELGRRGFVPIRAATFAADRAVLFVELAVAALPAVARHEGPPVAVREHAEGFYRAYADESTDEGGDESTDDRADDAHPAVPGRYGPFLDGERYVVERPREFTTARALLASDALFDVALGTRVEEALREEYDVLVGAEVATLADEFGVALARYFDPEP